MTALRAVIYASIFIGFVLVYFPCAIAQTDSGSVPLGEFRYFATSLYALGGAIGLWCVWSFIDEGRGTPAPFDPPRKLVARGLYRWVRNPMYIGGFLFLLGHEIWFGSVWLLAYIVGVSTVAMLFVRLYEEPTLRRKFGASYEQYLNDVPRWIPRPPRSA